MNDASNIIITNNQSDLTRIKFGKVNNKISTVVNISEEAQKNNQTKMKNNINNSQKIEKNVEAQKNNEIQNNKQINVNNNQNNNAQKYLNTSISFSEKNHIFLKLNRCCPLKIKIVFIIIFLIHSIIFLSIYLYDYISFWKNRKYGKNKEWLGYKFIIFLLQIIGALIFLFFLFIIKFINQGENNHFLIACIIFIIIFTSLRIYIFLKHIKISILVLFNLVYSLSIFAINIILLLLMKLINKKKKNVLQNIDEIIYFTENNMQTQKKEKHINYINNSPNNNILKKVIKPVHLVEDINDLKNKNGQ